MGMRPLQEALSAGKEIERLLVQKGLRGELFKEVMALARAHGIPISAVPVEKLNSITRANHQGIIAFISPVVYQHLENLVASLFEEGKVPLLLMLDGVTDVRNFGGICRTAECAGVHAVIIPEKGAAQINEDSIKSSAGALLHLPVCRSRNLQHTARYLRECGISLIAATEKGRSIPARINLQRPLCMVMGGEEKGIAPELLKMADELVRIPMYGATSSLNVSVATGMLLYETNRQRHLPGGED